MQFAFSLVTIICRYMYIYLVFYVQGRTGSDISTIVVAFFRFVEATRGLIFIDDIDIKDLAKDGPLSNLTINPILFVLI